MIQVTGVKPDQAQRGVAQCVGLICEAECRNMLQLHILGKDLVFIGHDRAPGGELFAGLEARARDFLDGLRGPALIVTHGITLHMLRLIAMDLPMSRLGELPVTQGALHIVSAGRHRMRV